MIRFLVGIVIGLAAAAVGLLVAASVLDDVGITATGFVVAVVIFAVAQMLLAPLFTKTALQSTWLPVGAVGLVTTFVALVVTDLISDGLSIEGAWTWILATLIVWVATMIAAVLLPVILVKMGVQSARERRA